MHCHVACTQDEPESKWSKPEVGGLTPEQRRAVWEEQRAAAEKNKKAVREADRPGGLAAFLGEWLCVCACVCARARSDFVLTGSA